MRWVALFHGYYMREYCLAYHDCIISKVLRFGMMMSSELYITWYVSSIYFMIKVIAILIQHEDNCNQNLDKQRNKAVDNRSSNGPMGINTLVSLNGGYRVRQDHWPDNVAALSTRHGTQRATTNGGHKADLAVICLPRLPVWPTNRPPEVKSILP